MHHQAFADTETSESMEFHSTSLCPGDLQDPSTRRIASTARLLDVLKIAKATQSSFLFVEDDQGLPLGVLSTEDVLRRVTRPSPRETQRWMDMTVDSMLPGRLEVPEELLQPLTEQELPEQITQVTRSGHLLGMMTNDDVYISWKSVCNTLASRQGDGVTGLPNRATFDYHLEAECNRAAREGTSIAVLLIDLDYFKQINDEHGHSAGDHALKTVGGILRKTLRSYDVVARFGGDEFAVICSGCRLNEIDIVMRRVREAVMASQKSVASDRPIPSISVGAVVAFDVPSPAIRNQLLEEADTCLYAAKKVGRNCGFKKELHVMAAATPVFVPDRFADVHRVEEILRGATSSC